MECVSVGKEHNDADVALHVHHLDFSVVRTPPFAALLKACAQKKDLCNGASLHAHILKRGLLHKSPYIASALVSMYAKCGALAKAEQVLDELLVRDVFSWFALIAGYVQQGRPEEAINCLERMQHEGLPPNEITFIYILKACGSTGAVDKGKQIHDHIVSHGLLGKNVALGNALVDMYAKCGMLAKAQQVLDELPVRDVVSWNTLITGYAQKVQGEEALKCYERMKREGLVPNAVTFACILKACGSIEAADSGKQIHDEIVCQGLLGKHIMISNALVDMYVKCGELVKAQQVLDELPVRNVVTWSALIAGYAQLEQAEEALNCFEQMKDEGLSPNAVTFACILKACGSIGAADKGKQIHDEIVCRGLLKKNVVLGTALVDMYAKCGALAKAQRVLDELHVRNVVSWNAMIAGYAQQGQGEEALNCFERMQREGFSPDIITFGCILKACGSIRAAEKGKEIYDEIVSQGLLAKHIVLGTTSVDMYAKCGALAEAQQVLEELPVWDVVLWNALIAGYAQHERGEEALGCFEKMQWEGFSPDAATFACILKACGSIGASDKGKQIHDEIVRQGLLGKEIEVDSALVGMYAKCGSLAEAKQVLVKLPLRNVVSWNALIAGYAQQVQGEEAVKCYEQMQREGLSPDAVTFISMLNACSRSGLLDEGQTYSLNMSHKFGITPGIEHYTCMVDLFGRAGHFDKAIAMIKKMPSSGYPPVWSALLGACGKWGNVKLGKWAFECAVQVDEDSAAAYVCMANIYAAAGMYDDAEKVEAIRLKMLCGRS